MSATPAEAFAAWCAFLAPTEGGLSLDPADSGNFTPDGRLLGTKFGISAHSYPTLDIPNLTIEQANHIRRVDFWDKVRGDELPGPIAFVLAEAAYGSGPGRAIMQMQSVVGVTADGGFGPNTMAALIARFAKPGGIDAFVVEFSAQRLLFEASLGDKWDHNKVGWTRRLFGGAAIALDLDNQTMAAPVVAPPAVADVTPSEVTRLRAALSRIIADAQLALAGIPVTGPAFPDPDNSADDLNAQVLAGIRGDAA